MAKLISLAFALFFDLSAAATTEVANVALPCDSLYQVLSPDGAQVAVRCKDHSLHVLSVPDGKELRVIPAEPVASTVVYSPDGRWMAIGFHDGDIEVASSKGLAAAKRWQASARSIEALRFFPNARMLVAGPADSDGQVWELAESPKLRATLPSDFGGITDCAVSPDGKVLVVAGGDTILHWYDTVTWRKTHENRDFLLDTFTLTFTPDGKEVLVGGADARITVLDAATAKLVRQLPREAGSSVGALDVFGDRRTAAIYFDDAGDKPPHELIWRLADAKVAARSDTAPSCEAVVGGKLWSCVVDGRALRISQYE
jgi:WD40 repeat protein